MDLTSRLRSIVRPPNAPPRELTYEPDTGRYEATIDLDRASWFDRETGLRRAPIAEPDPRG